MSRGLGDVYKRQKVELPSAKPIGESKLEGFKAMVQESKEALKVFDLEGNEVAYE